MLEAIVQLTITEPDSPTEPRAWSVPRATFFTTRQLRRLEFRAAPPWLCAMFFVNRQRTAVPPRMPPAQNAAQLETTQSTR